jgi:ABC-type antimicrobial peptide transport system permease subunit
MFDFPVKWGNKQQFSSEDGIVLTNEISQMLFGQQNPVGKNIAIRFSKNDKEILANFTVKGVLEDRPIDASFYFFALVPYQRLQALGMDIPGDWKESVSMTFLEGDNSTSLASLKQDKYLKLYNDANKVDKIVAYNFQSLTTMNFHAYKVQPLRFSSTPIVGYIMLLVIAIATLLTVYFNYTSIAMASASARLKEIGVRKVMGSGRKQIIVQFITENLILCTFGVLAGLFLAKTIFLPWFSRLSNVDLAKTCLQIIAPG